MVKGILGIKKGMTQMFDDKGNRIPVTVVEAGPCRVVQVKTKDRDGYEAVQLGFGEKKHSRVKKPERAHSQKADVPVSKMLREFQPDGDKLPDLGQEIKVDLFQVGELVDVTGITIGKGFAGVMKRHGFAGGPGGHGSNFHRAPGSIGCRSVPGRIHKNKRMGGHMGARRRTVQKIKIMAIDLDKNMIVLKGSVPGHDHGIIEIRKTIKPRKK